ncbi:MAG: S9 family peptidase [Bacteroidales bacterium]|jgi:dipeptidyl-peptidase-4|nr:S9 family peptidase [Bacteroidales bacterium]NPV35685.1 S9 family peptidase [Bacteroidales bacterium]
MRKNSLFVLWTALLFGLASHLVNGQTKELSLDVIFKNRELRTKGPGVIIPLRDGIHYLKNDRDTLWKYDYSTGKKDGYLCVFSDIKDDEGKNLDIDEFTLSPDETLMLIATETEAIYRHSSKSEYYIYDLSKNQTQRLSVGGKQRLAEFSPDGRKVAFVRENNLYIKDLSSGSETAITTDGKLNSIIYGTTDWVYEEEFSFTRGFFWSPDGSRIAYYRFDESRVKEFNMPMYGTLYPEEYRYKYPKAGEDNSIVDIFVYDLKEGKSIKLNTGSENDQYLPRMMWADKSGMLAVQRLNRLQNHLEIILFDPATGNGRVVYEEKNKWYIEITDDMTFLPGGKEFLITSQKSGYNHIYLINTEGKPEKQLTNGNWEVEQILGYNPLRKLIYFKAAYSSPLNREICSVDLKGRMKVIAGIPGTNTAQFDPTYKWFLKSWSDANTPPVYSICDANGKEIRIIEDNAALKAKMPEWGLQIREFFTFKTGQGVDLNGWMIKPSNFDPTKRYPVLVYLYGGPGSQTVTNSWGGGQLWYQMLAQKGIVVVSVDNRGTGFRGEEFRKMTYGQLGKYETEDQIELAKYLINQGIAEPGRIGIFGWSYGGYMSSLCMTKGSEYYNVGIAVAPVTNWRYYDNIYTERYMGLPKDNPNGYDDNSPINHVSKLNGKYLLIHGTADDNVHFQNSVEMVTALVNANKQFQTMYYPNSNHGIYTGRNTTYHLYTLMTQFLMDNLLK